MVACHSAHLSLDLTLTLNCQQPQPSSLYLVPVVANVQTHFERVVIRTRAFSSHKTHRVVAYKHSSFMILLKCFSIGVVAVLCLLCQHSLHTVVKAGVACPVRKRNGLPSLANLTCSSMMDQGFGVSAGQSVNSCSVNFW